MARPKRWLFTILPLLACVSASAQEWQASSGTWTGPADIVIAVAQSDWDALWAKTGALPPAPEVDFGGFLVAGNFSQGSYTLSRRPKFQMTPFRPSATGPKGPALDQKVGETLQRHKDEWRWTASFGPARTNYFPTDVHVKSSQMDVVFKDVQLRERHNMEAWDVFHSPHPLKAIDEPTNTLIIRAENLDKGYALSLKYFHPKFLLTGEGYNTEVRADGVIDGQAVNGPVDFNKVFSQYQMTYGQFNISLGAEKTFVLARGKAGTLIYAPGVSAGVIFAANNIVRMDGWGQAQETEHGIQAAGYSLGMSNRLTYAIPGDRFELSAMHEVSGGPMKYKAMDGTATQKLVYSSVNATLGVRLTKKKRKTP